MKNGQRDQAATPRNSIQAPIKTQAEPVKSQTNAFVVCIQFASQNRVHISKAKAPVPQEARLAQPFIRPHSQAPAAIRIKVSAAKSSGVGANKAGNNNANKINAVMSLCLSIGSLLEGEFQLNDSTANHPHGIKNKRRKQGAMNSQIKPP
jgi:hypothetical protein